MLRKMKTDEQSTPLNEMLICSICLTTDTPVIGGVETLACNFSEGKNMDDFMKVVQKWDAWASVLSPGKHSLPAFITTIDNLPQTDVSAGNSMPLA
jgi:hypothetical protein